LHPETPLRVAHHTSHLAKDRLMARFPQLVDVVIHIEPPPSDDRLREGAFGDAARILGGPL
jgi:divalent metal cation (Fe/Co/Zn/Cd) transporter